MISSPAPSIAIITTCQEDWGGSEELWAQAIPHLQAAGFELRVFKNNLNTAHAQFAKLRSMGVHLHELQPDPVLLRDRVLNSLLYRLNISRPQLSGADQKLSLLLNAQRPGLVLISQGINFDGINMAYICSLSKIPYVLISQKAVEFYWPPYTDRAVMRILYQHALKAYFVSVHNKELTEEQFGFRFKNAEVISNPIKLARKRIEAPDTENGYRLACIGRYFLLDKGQDILIRILALPKWKERPLTVSFIGSGIDKQGLVEMAALLEVTNVEFLDQVEDIAGLWRSYHGLVLPARSEGTPLVLLEAMACARVAIVSTAGGNAEFIKDGYNGFLGQPNVIDFDLALERAWARRHEWACMGNKGLEVIQEKVPYNPEKVLAAALVDLHKGLAAQKQ